MTFRHSRVSEDEDTTASWISESDSESESVACCGIATWTAEHERFVRVCEAERRMIEDRMVQNSVPETTTRFSVAFSGGGMRAAAFQAGVLWRLALAGQLKNVEYLSAVSGGAYIASAFASHAQRFEEEPEGEDLDEWYRTVVARTICQMQDNAGNFVRDPFGVRVSRATSPAGRLGRGLACPKIFDLPILIGTLFVTLLSFPLICLLFILIPTVEFIEMFFGSAMRGSFCVASCSDWYTVFDEWSPWSRVMFALQVLIPLTFVCWLILKLLVPPPPVKRQFSRNEDPSARSFSSLRSQSATIKDDDERRRNEEPWAHLFLRSTLAVLIRLTILILMLASLIASVTFLERWAFSRNSEMQMQRQSFCLRYINSEGMDMDNASAATRCANQHSGEASSWYAYPAFRDNFNYTSTRQSLLPAGPSRHLAPEVFLRMHEFMMHHGDSLPTMTAAALVVVLAGALLLTPFIPGIFMYVLFFAGPCLFVTSFFAVLQYRVYGPLTGQLLFHTFHFDRDVWEIFCWRSLLGVVFIFMPFYNSFRSIFHRFYRRSLRVNFFSEGSDVRMVALRGSRLLPFLVYTGTVNDYIRPGDVAQHHHTTEISFSPLHMGSETTGYVEMPDYQTLSKCTALTGAGGVDAISLSLNDGSDLMSFLKYRFWLEVLSLSWGDYILFLRHSNVLVDFCTKRCFGEFGKNWLGKNFIWGWYRAPTLICIFFAFGLQCYAWEIATFEPSPQNCLRAKTLMLTSLFLSVLIVSLSFFSFAPPLRWLSFEPILRGIQQMSQFAHCGQHPPGLLYVTDGGAFDCTTLLQLTKRGCRRILLVLAASDPDDDFGQLRAAMRQIVDLKIGSFYDLSNPHANLDILLEEFKLSTSLTQLDVGICYGWHRDEGLHEHGVICVVKNRMPDERMQRKLPNLLDEDTLKRKDGPPPDDERDDVDLCESDLGGFGCCSCCHFHGCNCGRKFPHLNHAGFLWLTPENFNSLCRLGYALSEDAVRKISDPAFHYQPRAHE